MTPRLRLEPIRSELVEDLWRVHDDEGVAYWYAGRLTRAQAEAFAAGSERAWAERGIAKWLAYDRNTGELVGRGGPSSMSSGSSTERAIRSLLGPGLDWTGIELGWALRAEFWGRGYATEIGRAGLDLAFDGLAAPSVVAFTERHNVRSRAVMERLEMRLVGEILTCGLVEGSDEVREDAPFAVYLARASPTRRT